MDIKRSAPNPNSKKKPNYPLRRLGATAAGLLLTAGVTYGAIEGGKAVVGKIKGPEVPELDTPYVVQPGDNAQNIADRFLPDGADLRPLGDAIHEQGGSDGLQPGETILTPSPLNDG